MMQDYKKLVEALRCCAGVHTKPTKCPDYGDYWCGGECLDKHLIIAADAIEALQAEVDTLKRVDYKRCQECLYLGQPIGEQQLPKLGEWKCSYLEIEPNPMFMYGICSICGFEQSISNKLNYCPNCGAKMEVQDGQ